MADSTDISVFGQETYFSERVNFYNDINVSGNVNFTGNLYQNGSLINFSGNESGSGGESVWVTTAAGIHTLSNVGIGTTNPSSTLTVAGGNNVDINLTAYSSTLGATPVLTLAHSNSNTIGVISNLSIGDFLGTISFKGASAGFVQGASIYAVVSGSPGSSLPSDLVFATGGGGMPGIPTPSMRLTKNSELLIGSETVTGTTNQTLQVHLGGAYVFGDVGIGIANPTSKLHVNGTSTLSQVAETVINNFNSTLAPSSGTLTIDTSLGTVVLGDLNASVTTWAFTNVPTTDGRAFTVTAIIDGDTSQTYGDACTVNGTSISGGIKWVGGSAPIATNNFDFITFIIVRDNAGTVNVFGAPNINYS